VFAVAAFAVAGAARRRRHVADASLLAGLGLDRRGARNMIVLEDAVLAVLAAVIGVGIGIVLAELVLPMVAFTETGRAAVPRPTVSIPWATVALLAAGAIGAIVLEATVRARGAGRASIAAELRTR
jgi:ABC-type antimicrobial peptide transport system permease subunit